MSFNFMVQSPSAVILEPKKIKSDTVSTVSPSISHEAMGPAYFHLYEASKKIKFMDSKSRMIVVKRLRGGVIGKLLIKEHQVAVK